MPNHEAAEKFERVYLDDLCRFARISAFCRKWTNLVGIAAVSWATIVLMGGFASSLSVPQFERIVFFSLFILCGQFADQFFTDLMTTHSLDKGPLDPVRLSYRDERSTPKKISEWVVILLQLGLNVVFVFHVLSVLSAATAKRLLSAIFQYLLYILFALQYPNKSSRFENSTVSQVEPCLNPCLSDNSTNTTVQSVYDCVISCFPETMADDNNLESCLSVFMMVVAAALLLQVFYLLWVGSKRWYWRNLELGLKKYHDEIMSQMLNQRTFKAHEFDTMEFFLHGLEVDLTLRNIPSLAVKKQHLKILDYLYDHPSGVQMVFEGLASSRSRRKQTAANIVGFWAKKDFSRQGDLLSRLAENLGQPGKAAEAAANSFCALAKNTYENEPSPLLKVQTTTGDGACNVVEKVINLVMNEHLPTLQVYMRLIDGLFMSESIRTWLKADHGTIEEKLMAIAKQQSGAQGRRQSSGPDVRTTIKPNIRARTALIAFSAWVRLVEGNKSMDESKKKQAEQMMYTLDQSLQTQEFLWYDEKDRFKDLCKQYPSANSEKPLGSWLSNCDIRGAEFANLP